MDALDELISIGGSCNTVSSIPDAINPHPVQHHDLSEQTLHLYIFCPAGHCHTMQDYHQYRRHALEILSSGPHLWAALLCGGIIW